jgi:hypothetical protein
MARTAVVAGTATAVSGSVQRKAAAKAEQQAPAGPPPAAAAPPVQAPEAPAADGTMTEDRLNKLKELGELKTAGVLTEEEFTAEKRKILYS